MVRHRIMILSRLLRAMLRSVVGQYITFLRFYCGTNGSCKLVTFLGYPQVCHTTRTP